MKVTKKLTGLFWRSTGDGAAEARVPVAASAEQGVSNVVPIRPAPLAHAPDGREGAGGGTFSALFATTPGEPNVDQLLVAFESIRGSMPASQVAIALSATIVALGAEDAAIVGTLEARTRALASLVDAERGKVADRERARSAELEATTAAVQAEIKTMEAKISALREQLASATEGLARKATNERASLATLEQRAQAETSRLQALREVLTPASRLARKH